MRDKWVNDRIWYILSVILALALFSPTAIILPTLEDKSSLTYQVLFFIFTLGAVVLLFFAANLIIAGLKRTHSISPLSECCTIPMHDYKNSPKTPQVLIFLLQKSALS